MWPFRRQAKDPVATGPQPAPAPIMRREWTSLAPIQRLVGPHPLTAPSDRFSGGLATHQDPSLSREGMGHQVSPEAPSGLVLSLARPTTRNDGPAMIGRPAVQRRAQPTTTDSGEWEVDEAASDAARPAPLTELQPPAGALRELPVASAVEPAVQRLTTVAEGDPMPVVPRTPRPSLESVAASVESSFPSPISTAPATSAPRLTLGQVRRLGLGAPISRVPERSLQRSSETAAPVRASAAGQEASLEPPGEVHARTPDAPAAASIPVARVVADTPARTSAESRPLAPIIQRLAPAIATPPIAPAAVEAVAPAEPQTADLPLAARSVAEPPPGGTRAGTPQMAGSSDLAPAHVTENPSNPSIPLAPQRAPAIQRITRVSSDTGLTDSEAGHGVAPSSTPLSKSPAPAVQTDSSGSFLTMSGFDEPSPTAMVAPLVGQRPLRPTASSVQRTETGEPTTADRPVHDADEPASAGLDLAPSSRPSVNRIEAGVQTPAGTDDFALVSPLQVLDDEPAHLPSRAALRMSPGIPSALASGAEGLTRAPLVAQRLRSETRAAPMQRTTRNAAPFPLAATWAAPAAAAHSIFPDLASTPGLPLAPSVPAPVQRAIAEMAVQRVEATAPLAVKTVQRETEAPAAAASPSAAAVSSAPAAAAGPEQSDHQLDELAGRLYDRIRSRLKTELLVDRERAGFLTDLR
jgi:hypothetical protein